MIKAGVTYMMNPLTYNINYSINLNIKYKVKALTLDFFIGEKSVFAFIKDLLY